MAQRNTLAAAHRHQQRTRRSLSTNKIQVRRAGMHRNRYQTTTSLFPGRASEVELHHLLREAGRILLRTRGSKWRLLSRLRALKLTLSRGLFRDRLEVTLILLYCR